MRRRLLPAVLGAVALLSSALAVRSAAPPSAPEAAGSPLRPVTPVLSLRRAPALLARAAADGALQRDLDRVLADKALGAARERSCLVVEDGDRRVYEHRPGQTLVPASTLKVLTGTAALRRLGDEFRFRTLVVAAEAPSEGVVEGPLWLVGGGDPLLGTADYAATFANQPQLFTPLEDLAQRVVDAGVREVRGEVRGDESRYDTVRFVPSWNPGYRADNDISAVSALTVNDNFNPYGSRRRVAVADPAQNAAAVFSALLRQRGVTVGEASAGDAPRDAHVVAQIESPRLPAVVGQMLRESDNLTAEMLVKELGTRFGSGGTWTAGLDVVRETIEDARLPVREYQAADGSGLDRSDRVSCRLLMGALDLAGPGSDLASGFAVAGRTGTLSRRFLDTPLVDRLRAKTGTLNHVVGLVGYLETTRQRTLEFALLANDLPDRLSTGQRLQERIAAVLARYPDAPASERLRPLPPVARP